MGLDAIAFFFGEVVAAMLIPLVLASLVVLFKRFRKAANFIWVSQFVLWAIFVLLVAGMMVARERTGYGSTEGHLFLVYFVASALLICIPYLKKAALWLKGEIV